MAFVADATRLAGMRKFVDIARHEPDALVATDQSDLQIPRLPGLGVVKIWYGPVAYNPRKNGLGDDPKPVS